MATTSSRNTHGVYVDPGIPLDNLFPGADLPYPGDPDYARTVEFLESLPSDTARARWHNWRKKYRESLKTGNPFTLATMLIRQDEDGYLFVDVLGSKDKPGIRVYLRYDNGYWTTPEPKSYDPMFSRRAPKSKTKSKTRKKKVTSGIDAGLGAKAVF